MNHGDKRSWQRFCGHCQSWIDVRGHRGATAEFSAHESGCEARQRRARVRAAFQAANEARRQEEQARDRVAREREAEARRIVREKHLPVVVRRAPDEGELAALRVFAEQERALLAALPVPGDPAIFVRGAVHLFPVPRWSACGIFAGLSEAQRGLCSTEARELTTCPACREAWDRARHPFDRRAHLERIGERLHGKRLDGVNAIGKSHATRWRVVGDPGPLTCCGVDQALCVKIVEPTKATCLECLAFMHGVTERRDRAGHNQGTSP